VRSGRVTAGVALALLLVVTALAIFAPWLATHHYAAQDLSAQYLPPATAGHLLGTDLQGRDLYSRTIYGARVSLLVAAAATIVSLLIGVTYGLVSGYVGGRTDSIMMRVVDVLYSLPFLFLVILIMTLFVGPRASPTTRVMILLLVLGAVQWLTMARIVRGQVLSEKTREYVQAAKALGVGHTRILFRHLLPNLSGIILTYAALTVPRVMLQEAFLSFLGLGVPEPYPSWGRLAADGVRAITPVASHWWLVVVPSLMITVTLFALNLLGDGLGEAGRRKRNTVGPA
jgi:oligopeptide transport system permease protein